MTHTLVDERMTDVDALVWTIEREPRLRSTIAALAICEGQVPASALRHRVERAARIIPRLRQHVVSDPLGVAPPRWALDPDFQLSFHLRTTTLGGQGRERQLLDLVRDLVLQPFDRARPLWEFTLVNGLADGRSALLLKSHHSVSDGVGGMEMMLELFDLNREPTPDRSEMPEAPVAPESSSHPVGQSIRHESQQAIGGIRRLLETSGSPGDAVAAARRLGKTLGSASRVLKPSGEPMSPLMTDRSAGLEFHMLSLPLDSLRDAAARIGGSINDSFVAAVAIGTADHHRAHGVELPGLRISIPMSTRVDGDGVGNHWTPGRIELATDNTEPDAMMREVHSLVAKLRTEPGHALIEPMAAVLRRMPAAAAASVFSSMSSGVDLAASNVPGSPIPLHLCGQEVVALVPFGPLSGCATNITLISHAGVAHIGIVVDPAAVTDGEAFAAHIEAAFSSVVKGS